MQKEEDREEAAVQLFKGTSGSNSESCKQFHDFKLICKSINKHSPQGSLKQSIVKKL